jgi:hypothetical protein
MTSSGYSYYSTFNVGERLLPRADRARVIPVTCDIRPSPAQVQWRRVATGATVALGAAPGLSEGQLPCLAGSNLAAF